MTNSKQNHSGHYGEAKVVSDTHYTLGIGLYMTNADCVEFKIENGKRIIVAFIDYKYPGEKLSTTWQPIQMQNDMAATYKVPFFFALTFLDKEKFNIPMYYVIGVNKLSLTYLDKPEGQWMTVKEYSKFQHKLRGMEFNKYDIDLAKLSDEIAYYNDRLPDCSEMEVLP